MKKFSAVIALALVLAFALGGCAGPGKEEEAATLSVAETSLTMETGEEHTLQVTSNYPSEVTYASDNPAVASVDAGGKVRAEAPGDASITVRVRDKSASVKVTVAEPAPEPGDDTSGVTQGENIVYTFRAEQSGLYDLTIESADDAGDLSALDDAVAFRVDDSYKTRLKSKRAEDGEILLGTKYLEQGIHTLTVEKGAAVLEGSALRAESTLVYGAERLSLAKTWMDVLYQETGYNTELPNYLGYVETEGWDDIWTHCQYLPYSMYIAAEEQNAEYDRRVRAIADELLIGKMLRSDGAVYTIYRADDDVFQVSIEPDMPTNKYELWRGNAAFAEEMMNCYLYTGEAKYLDYAKTAMDYILTNWTKTNVSGIFGGIYTRYSDSAGGAIDIMSVGRAVMVFAQLYQLTGEAKYLSAAKAQGKILLKAQETPYPELEGLFASAVRADGSLDEFRHGNAFANAMFGLAWLYKTTGDSEYLEAIDKGVRVLDTVYDDELGMIVVMNGELMPKNESTGAGYMAGRIGQAILTCAAFTGEPDYWRQGERVMEFAMGRNYGNRDFQNPDNGWYYYGVEYTGTSNSETSCEIYLAQLQYYYLKEIWKII